MDDARCRHPWYRCPRTGFVAPPALAQCVAVAAAVRRFQVGVHQGVRSSVVDSVPCGFDEHHSRLALLSAARWD